MMSFTGGSRGSGCDNPVCALAADELDEDPAGRDCGLIDAAAYAACVADPNGPSSPLQQLGTVQQSRSMALTYRNKQKFHLKWTPQYSSFSMMNQLQCPWLVEPFEAPMLPGFGRNFYFGPVRLPYKGTKCECVEKCDGGNCVWENEFTSE